MAKSERVRLKAPGALRVAICGCGSVSRRHVQNLLELPEVDVVALADVRHEACTRLRDEELVPRGRHCSVFHTLDEQLRLAQLDAVVIATPYYLHYPQAKAALEAGVHVLLEKPMVTSPTQARELMTLACKKKRVLALAYQGPYTPEFNYIRRVRREGILGQIRTVGGFINQDWLAGVKGTWRVRRKQAGGGILYDAGSHLLHAVLWLTELEPAEVFAFAENCKQEVEVVAAVIVHFSNGAVATLMANGDSRLPRNGIQLHGTEGVIVTSVYGEFLEHYIDGQKVKYPSVSGGSATPEANFIAAIRGQEELLCPADYGLKLARLLEAIYRSIRTRKPVKPAK